MRKRRRENVHDPTKRLGMKWRIEDFTRVRARRQMLALEAARLDVELARERRVRAAAGTRCVRTAYGSRGRAMVVRWMFAEGRQIEIASATVGLAVCYLDAIVNREAVKIGDMQALASACLHLARKFHEVGGDGMDFIETEESVMNKDVEMYAIETLEWRLAIPTPFTFITKLMDKFWIAEDARPTAVNYLESLIAWEESLEFYPSTIACVAILALSRDKVLHPASKEMLFKFISTQEKMVEDTSNALRTFHNRLGGVSAGAADLTSTDSSSSFSSAGSGDDLLMNMLTLDYVERCVSLPRS